MLSVRKLTAGRRAADYYLDQTRRGLAAYYLADEAGGESTSRQLAAPGTAWWGGGAGILGLDGTVDRTPFVNLYSHGLRPDGDDPLGRPFRLPEDVAVIRTRALAKAQEIKDPGQRARAEFVASQQGGRPSVAAWDCTFSPVKSVSLLWAAGDTALQEQVWAAHTTAVDHGLAYLEEHAAYVRVGRNGQRTLDTDGLVVARFNEWSSRDGDMQLHTHCLVLNRARTREDGRWRALDGAELLRARIGAGAVYDRVLEAELSRRLGVAWRERGTDALRELVGVDDELIRAFSTRTRSITAELEAVVAEYERTYGVEPTPAIRWSLAQHATLDTRRRKKPLSSVEALTTWEARMREQGRRLADLPDQVVGRQPRGTLPSDPRDEDRDRLLEVLAQDERATVTRHGLVRAALDVLPPTAVTPEEVRRRAERLVDRAMATPHLVQVVLDEVADPSTDERRQDGTSVWAPPGRARWALRATLDQEAYLLKATVEPTGLSVPAHQIERAIDRHALGPDQSKAVRTLLGDRSRVKLLVGAAGTGKTRALRAAVDAWHTCGREVLGLTVSQSAAEVLASEANVRTENIAKWRQESGRGRWRLSSGALVLVDEASMARTADMVDLVVQAREAGARLLLIGDPAQLGAIGVGGAFELVADRAGAVHLEEIRRFSEDWERRASRRLHDREPLSLLPYLEHGRVHGGTRDEVEDAMFAAWSDDVLSPARTDRPPTVMMIVRTNEQAARLSARARDLLLGEWRVDRGPTVQLRDNEASAGDRIVTRRNDRTLATSRGGWVVNGDIWEVRTRHRDGSVTAVRMRDADTVRLPASYLADHVQLAYATTAHRAQGMTVDRCHAFIDGSEGHHLLYVAATRGRESNHLWVGLDTPRRSLLPGDPVSTLVSIIERQDDTRRAATTIRDEEQAQWLRLARR